MQGLAVISGNRLLDYRIQLRKEPWTPRKEELILASLEPWCSRYNITSVVLSIPYEKQTSTQTKTLLDSIKTFFFQKKIKLYCYPPESFRKFCEEAKKKTKKEMMYALTTKYPELLGLYKKEVRNKHEYYIKLFEAVAVATIHAEGSRKRTG